MRENHRDVIAWLRLIGALDVHMRSAAKHPRICFEFDGRTWEYAISGSTGDSLGSVNAAKKDLRHMLGLVLLRKRVGCRRRRRERSAGPAPQLPAITPGKDWAAPLQRHPLMPEVLALRLDEAWLRFWRDCMRSVGARSRL